MSRRHRKLPLTPEEQRFDLAGWLRRNAPLASAQGSEWILDCPFCMKPKLAVNVTRKAWQCFTCKFRGWRPTVLIAALSGIGLFEAAAAIATGGAVQATGPVDQLTDPEAPDIWRLLPEAPMAPGVVRELRDTQANYLLGRGIPKEHMIAFGLGTVLGDRSRSKADRLLSGRIFFPVWDRATLVFWTAREAFDGGRLKVLNLPRSCNQEKHQPDCTCFHDEWGLRPVPRAATAADTVMGLHLVQPGDEVFVLEGPVDGVMHGPGAIPIFGSRLHAQQAIAISGSAPSTAIVALDGDQAGRDGQEQVARLLSLLMPTKVLELPWGTDPGNLGRDRMLQLAAGALQIDAVGELRKIAGGSVGRPPSSSHFVPPL
jgi:hypothetical protein